MNYKTIGEWEEGIRRTLDKLPFSQDLAPDLEPLLTLVPTHVSPRVEFRYHTGRKIREDAAAAYFQPESCQVLISFELRREGPAGSYGSTLETDATPPSLDPEMRDLLRTLGRAEATMPFVALKWFRDQYLPEHGDEWAAHPAARHQTIRRAIDESLVLKSQIPNPNNPEHPTTTVSVNKHHPKVRGIMTEQNTPRFRPVEIRGEPLSKTVLDDRR